MTIPSAQTVTAEDVRPSTDWNDIGSICRTFGYERAHADRILAKRAKPGRNFWKEAGDEIATLTSSLAAASARIGELERIATKSLGLMESRFDTLARDYRGYLPDVKPSDVWHSDVLTRVALIDDATASFRKAADELSAALSQTEEGQPEADWKQDHAETSRVPR